MPSPRLLRRAALALALGAASGVALGAASLVALADPPPERAYPPDPPTQTNRKHWVFDLDVRGGKVSIARAKALTLAKPTETTRTTGRFALELYIGKQLLERKRFNVPLLGDERPVHRRNKLFRAPSLDDVTTRVSAEIADHPRAVYLLLVDRITGDEQRFDWPPKADGQLLPWATGQLSDAGADDLSDGGARVIGRSASHADASHAGNADAGNADAGNADSGSANGNADASAPRAPGDAGRD